MPRMVEDDDAALPPYLAGAEQLHPAVIAIIGTLDKSLLQNIAKLNTFTKSPLQDLVFYTGFLHGRKATKDQYIAALMLYPTLLKEEESDLLVLNLEFLDGIIEGHEHLQKKLAHQNPAIKEGYLKISMSNPKDSPFTFKSGYIGGAAPETNCEIEQWVYTQAVLDGGPLFLDITTLAYLRGILVQNDRKKRSLVRTQTDALESVFAPEKPSARLPVTGVRARLQKKVAESCASGAAPSKKPLQKQTFKKLSKAEKAALKAAQDAELDELLNSLEQAPPTSKPAQQPSPAKSLTSTTSSTTVSAAATSSDDESSHPSTRGLEARTSPSEQETKEIDLLEVVTTHGLRCGRELFGKLITNHQPSSPFFRFFYSILEIIYLSSCPAHDLRTFHTALVAGFDGELRNYRAATEPTPYTYSDEEEASLEGQRAGKQIFSQLIELVPLGSHWGGSSFAFYYSTIKQLIDRELKQEHASKNPLKMAYHDGFTAGFDKAHTLAQRESLEAFKDFQLPARFRKI